MTDLMEPSLRVLEVAAAIWTLVTGAPSVPKFVKYVIGKLRRMSVKWPIKRAVVLNVTLALAVLALSAGGLYFLDLPLDSPQDFVITSPRDGQIIQNQDLPLTVNGTYSSEGSDKVWALLEDHGGLYYLQNPPVHFYPNGEWTAPNVSPGPGIIRVDLVQVGWQGQLAFQLKAATKDFGGFSTLPTGGKIVATVSIVSQTTG